MMTKCELCCTDESECEDCRDNPIYNHVPKQSKFTEYKPVCPYGYYGCINDPAYYKKYYPEEYNEDFGDVSPEVAITKDACCNACHDGDRYDDEDK